MIWQTAYIAKYKQSIWASYVDMQSCNQTTLFWNIALLAMQVAATKLRSWTYCMSVFKLSILLFYSLYLLLITF